jgi:hypothetical protein
MSSRTTRALALGLVSSALILTLFVSCSTCNDGRGAYAGGTGYHRRSYWPWYFGGGWGRSYSGPSYRPSSPSSGHGTTRSTGGATSRGGFGGTGHSSAG